MSFQQLWNRRKERDGVLAKDGDYFGLIESVACKTLDNGKELFEFKGRIDEGEFKGESFGGVVFYYDPEKPEDNRGAKTLFTYLERLNPVYAAIDDATIALNKLEAELPNRKVKITQKTGQTGYVGIYIREVYEYFGPVAQEEARKAEQSLGLSEAQSNIPF